MHKKAVQRLTGIILSVIMVADMLSVSAVAQAGTLPIGASGEITAFEELAANIAVQSVPLGTSEADLELPDILTATISLGVSEEESVPDSGEISSEPDSADATSAEDVGINDNEGDTVVSPANAQETGNGSDAGSTEGTADSGTDLTVPLPVTWVSSPEYDGETAGTYFLTPELPEGLTLASGVNAPTITVTVSAPETTAIVDATIITGTVTAFDALSDDLRRQNTTAPEFPETVSGTVEGEAVEIPVTWEADHDYDAEAPQRGLYVFTAVLGEGVGLAEDVELPLITVFIPQTAGRMARMAGAGTDTSPLEITTAAQLAEIAALVNARENGLELFLFNDADAQVALELQNDLDLSAYGEGWSGGEGWVPIGTNTNQFNGSFDGGGNRITGLYINRSAYFQGLFGCIGSGGVVENLGVAGASVSGGSYIGGIAGYVSGTVQNCYSTGSVTGSGVDVGGVTGAFVSGGRVQNCYSASSVSGNSYVGGISGYISGTLQNCAALNPSVIGLSGVGRVAGSISGSGALTGNIAFGGMTGSFGTIEDSGSDKNGASQTAAEIGAAGFFETLFGGDMAWEYEEGKLPGFGAAVDLPAHIVDGSNPNFHGAGTSDNPFQIYTPADLAKLAELVNDMDTNDPYGGAGICYRLMNNLDLSGYGAGYDGGKGWIPIGSSTYLFRGSFDGAGNQITGLYINRNVSGQGLLGYMGNGGRIENLSVVNANVTGLNRVGCIAGSINGGTVENCYVSGDVSGNDSIVGGVAGEVNNGTVQNCYAAGSVYGSVNIVGGVAGGVVSNGTVQNCYAVGSVSGSGNFVGGVAGTVNNGMVQNCAALNLSVSGTDHVGRVAGLVSSTLRSNYAFDGMMVTMGGSAKTITSNADGVDGASKAAAEIAADSFWITAGNWYTAPWSSALWTFASGKLPVLKGIAGQDNTIPYHISGIYFPGGGTSEDDPYLISTPAQLAKLAELVNAPATNAQYGAAGVYYQLTADISLSGYASGAGWVPIGHNNSQLFRGHFDGGNHEITGLYINRPGSDFQGLFGYVYGTVQNLGVVNANITGRDYTSGVAGYVSGGAVENCYVTGSVSGGNAVGGVAGFVIYGGTVENCYVSGSVSGGSNVGGVAGYVISSVVQNCYSTGSVSGSNIVGGVAGTVSGGTVENCYVTGGVSGTVNWVGGVAGAVEGGGVVQNSYSTGSVSGSGYVGGVAGVVTVSGTVQNCAALNPSVIVTGGGNFGRVAGANSGVLAGNYAFNLMTGGGAAKIANGVDGADISIAQMNTAAFWMAAANWDAANGGAAWSDTVWTLANDNLPTLKNVGGVQSGDGGLYLTARDIQYATVTPDTTGFTYNGSEQLPALTVTFDGQTLVENTDYTAAITSGNGGGTSAGTNAGEVTLTLTGIDSFSGTKTFTYAIAPKPVTVTPDSGQSKMYGAADPALTYANSESLGADAFTGALSYASGENVGGRPFTLGDLSAGVNYALSLAPGVEFTIEQREITLAADNKRIARGSGLPTLTYSVGNLAPGETSADAVSDEPALACPIFDGNTLGSYDIILTGGAATDNYTIASRTNGTLTVNNPPPGGDSHTPSTPATTTPEKRPDQPVTVAATVTTTEGTNGTASAAVSDKTITDAIAKAQADAKAQGKAANGISVELNIAMPQGASSLSLTLSQNALQSLVNAGVTSLTIGGGIASLGLDLEALKEIQKQSTGDVTITIKPMTNLSAAAKKLIGKRPVYDVTISYIKAGKVNPVTSLGKGGATLSFPYSPGRYEAVGWLFGVYVDDKGNASRIPGSAFDVNSGSLILSTNHFSVYGVGYTAPTEKYTDIASHWAKESIDYVVGRGLFSGTTEKTFSPNMAMDRGMLVTVLGRLAGADVSAYKTSSFSDVTAGKYYLPYVEWAYKNGIISGIGGGKFAPERAVTREEIALILQNYAKATGYKLPVTREVIIFADNSSIGSSYTAAVKAMQQAGIMMGGTGNKFNPKAGATRAEVATMLHRYVKLTIDPATAQGWAKNDDGRYMYYKDGKPLTGWQTIDGVKYNFFANGTLQTGWVKDGNNWRFYSGNKALVGWWNVGSETSKKRYYFDVNAVMVSGKWLQIDGKWYYFYSDGSLAVSTKINGYEVDENGVRKTE